MEEREIKEAEARAPFDKVRNTFNFAKRRATDLKNNSRVYFPRKAKSIEVESVFQTIRVELMAIFKDYVSKNCGKGGSQKPN